MVTGASSTTTPPADLRACPPEHAASLTRAAGAATWLRHAVHPAAGGGRAGLIECFRQGGGVPYAALPRFQGDGRGAAAFASTPPCSHEGGAAGPGARRAAPSRASTSLDVGCGSGHAVNLLGRAFPDSRFVGYDFSEDGDRRRGARGRGRSASTNARLRRARRGRAWRADRASTWSPPSTPSTTRPAGATSCAGISRALRAGRHLPDGGRPRLERPRRTTSTTRWGRSSTRCRPCTA